MYYVLMAYSGRFRCGEGNIELVEQRSIATVDRPKCCAFYRVWLGNSPGLSPGPTAAHRIKIHYRISALAAKRTSKKCLYERFPDENRVECRVPGNDNIVTRGYIVLPTRSFTINRQLHFQNRAKQLSGNEREFPDAPELQKFLFFCLTRLNTNTHSMRVSPRLIFR